MQKQQLKRHALAQQRVSLRLRRRQKLPVAARSAAYVVDGDVAVAAAVCPPLPMLLPRQLQVLLEKVR